MTPFQLQWRIKTIGLVSIFAEWQRSREVKVPALDCSVSQFAQPKKHHEQQCVRNNVSSFARASRKPRRQRQRERRKTKGLMSRTMAVHVRYNSWYISLPSSAKQQRENTKFCFVRRTWTTTANYKFLKFYFKFIALSQIQFRENFDSDKQSKRLKRTARFVV